MITVPFRDGETEASELECRLTHGGKAALHGDRGFLQQLYSLQLITHVQFYCRNVTYPRRECRLMNRTLCTPSCYDSKLRADHDSSLPLRPHPYPVSYYFWSKLLHFIFNYCGIQLRNMFFLLENITILQSYSTISTINFYYHQICCWCSHFPGCSRKES